MSDFSEQLLDAQSIIKMFGLPKAQQNERSALSLLAVLGMTPTSKWDQAQSPLIGITPIMTWLADHYDKKYAPNTRETIRR
jgi:adenine-specific DNA-methyltransferase